MKKQRKRVYERPIQIKNFARYHDSIPSQNSQTGKKPNRLDISILKLIRPPNGGRKKRLAARTGQHSKSDKNAGRKGRSTKDSTLSCYKSSGSLYSIMNVQINRIRVKLKELHNLDKSNGLFGAQKHRYRLNPTISIDKIHQFEATHNVKLPPDYIEFLTMIGNGGVGPFYGLEPLQNSVYADLDDPKPDFLLNPSKPFPHTEHWNLKFTPSADEDEDKYEEELAAFEEKYFDTEHLTGVLAICNYGCAVSLNLVVNGAEYGNIWTDDRGSDNGIYPSYELGNKDRITFLNWYELWLDNSLDEMKTKHFTQDNQNEEKNKQTKKIKPWWKIW